MKVSIVIPAYNEANTIETVLGKIKSVKLPNDIFKEIIIVNDGSSDNTDKILEKYNCDNEVKRISHKKNNGKTAAIKSGIEQATGDIVIIQDADLEYDPQEYPKLIAPIISNEFSIVYGSRFKGSITGMQAVNRIANMISNFVYNILYPVKLTDINTCHKAFKKEVLEGINITSGDFTFETEITAKLVNKGYKIREVPINYVARSRKEGKKINFSKALDMFWGIIKFRNMKS